ncbi:MAG: bifunctional precorrin-2 dehydrogenase/sirohydrochlorin ferrochelatase [Chloroflexi bacterium]|nr:bifunctional precorrin-2 dehydrogenase/sirohydrochlorin ferrochelatase [Chloroflexota bacterium]
MAKQYYAAFLDLENKPVTVIGAGDIAEGKVRQLLPVGAQVTIIAPEVTEQVQRWADEGKITWLRRQYEPGDLNGAHFAIVGTDDVEVNHRAADEARAGRIMVNTVDDVAYCDFIAPAVVQRGDLIVAISTGGGSPAMARHMRDYMREAVPPWFADMLNVLSEVRIIVRGAGRRPDTELWQAGIDEDFKELIRSGQFETAKERMVTLLEQCGKTAAGCWCQGEDKSSGKKECAALLKVQGLREG